MGGGGPGLQQPRVPPAHLKLGRHARHPAQAERSAGGLPGLDWIYTHRNQVERLWARLKEWQAIATRYEKTARSFMGVLCLAATMDWTKC